MDCPFKKENLICLETLYKNCSEVFSLQSGSATELDRIDAFVLLDLIGVAGSIFRYLIGSAGSIPYPEIYSPRNFSDRLFE